MCHATEETAFYLGVCEWTVQRKSTRSTIRICKICTTWGTNNPWGHVKKPRENTCWDCWRRSQRDRFNLFLLYPVLLLQKEWDYTQRGKLCIISTWDWLSAPLFLYSRLPAVFFCNLQLIIFCKIFAPISSLFFEFIFQLQEIALQRNPELRANYWANVCLLDPEMLVFIDESGFVSIVQSL